MNRRPLHQIRLGLIVASIWVRRTGCGVRHQVTVTRLFRNGDVWKRSARFGRDDLPTLRRVLDLAHTWIFLHVQANRQERF